MPIFRHKAHHGGRYDDPHGVTAATRTRSELLSTTKSSKDKLTGRVTINSEPALSSEEAGLMYSKKEKKRMAKGLKEINKPKNRAESQHRGSVYNRAKADEAARMKTPILSDIDGNARGVAGAYAKGGFEGVEQYDKQTFGKEQENMGEFYKQQVKDPEIRKNELTPYR